MSNASPPSRVLPAVAFTCSTNTRRRQQHSRSCQKEQSIPSSQLNAQLGCNGNESSTCDEIMDALMWVPVCLPP